MATASRSVIDTGGGTGHLTVGGTVEPDGQWFVASANWSNVQYVGGSSAGTDSLRVEVYDATTKAWVVSAVFKAMTTSAPIIGIQFHQGLEHQPMI